MPRNNKSLWAAIFGAFSLLSGALAWLAAEPADTPPETRWYKGNLHTHSLWSDGNDFPEMVADWYRHAGYQFLALSDHNILSDQTKWIALDEVAKRGGHDALDRYRRRFGADWCETQIQGSTQQVRLKPLNEFRGLLEERERFLLVQAEEITDHVGPLPLHINAHNLRDAIQPQGGQTIREAIANNLAAVERQSERTGRPILAHLNHPNFGYGVTAEDLAAVTEERFFEVYNGHPDVHHQGDAKHPSVERLWDIANTIRVAELQSPPLFGLATDDAHQYFARSGPSPGRGWIQVRARRLTPESLIAALRAGEFYASSGVTLDDVRFDSESGVLEVRIQPDGDAQFTTHFIGTRRQPVVVAAQAEGLDAANGEKTVDKPARNEIGQTLATVGGLTARYVLTGDEWYVRAMVISTRGPANPSFKDQKAQAWTQPVGWKKWMPAPAIPAPAIPAPAIPAATARP